MSEQARKKVTVPSLRQRKHKGPKIAAVTAYDATMARLLDEAGVDVVLVGDSLGMVVQGHKHTLPVTVDDICYHGRAVSSAVRFAHVVGDMPFLSYQVSVKRAVHNAGKLLQQGGCESVKIEGGVDCAEQVRAIVSAGIPVMGHVGLTPQSVHAMGGFRVQGRALDDATRIENDAVAFEQAGAFSLVIEGVPHELAERITKRISIPTIGIGASAACDGQVLVCYDFLGMVRTMQPKFVKRFANVGDAIVQATEAYVREVRDGSFPSPSHCFEVTPQGAPAASSNASLNHTGRSVGAYGPTQNQ